MEIRKPPAPRESLLGMIGKHFRSWIVGPDPMILARRASICGMCNAPTDPDRRRWSHHFRRFVCSECIPAIVRLAGEASIVEWLETGTYNSGPISHREMVECQTKTGT
jgi:hypothetical protein